MEDSEIESAGAFVIDKTHVLGFLLRRGAWEPNRAGTGSRAAQLRRAGNAARALARFICEPRPGRAASILQM